MLEKAPGIARRHVRQMRLRGASGTQKQGAVAYKMLVGVTDPVYLNPATP